MSKYSETRQHLIETGKATIMPAYNDKGQLLGSQGLLIASHIPAFSEISRAIKKRYQHLKKRNDCSNYNLTVNGRNYLVTASIINYVIASSSAPLPEEFNVSGYYSAKTKYVRITLAASRISSKGNLILVSYVPVNNANSTPEQYHQNKPVANTPVVFGTPQQLSVACRDAIASMSGFKYKANNILNIEPSQKRFDLRNYFFNVTVNGITHQMRADYVFAMAKRNWKDGRDAYGIEPLGAVACGSRKKQWKLLYEASQHDTNNKFDVSNIDHVIPQARGGKTRVANLQMMRLFDNSSKRDEDIRPRDNKLKNAVSSIHMMLLFAKGIFTTDAIEDENTRKYVLPMVKADIVYSVGSIFA